jgi:hypothetical protein
MTPVAVAESRLRLRFRDATPDDAPMMAGLEKAAAGAGTFYARCGFVDRGRVVYKGDPLVYHELLLG